VIRVLYPAYDEEGSIGRALRSLAAVVAASTGEPYEAIVVDDGSRDGTAREVEACAAELGPRLPVRLLRHAHNQGLGAALRTGIYDCLERADDGDVIVTLDADNTHPPSVIPALVERAHAGNDVVIASRYRDGSQIHGVPPHRRALSDAGRLLFQALFPIPGVRDYTCCFRAYRVPALLRARWVYGDDLCQARGFESVMDLLLRLRPLGVRATEVPFELDYAERGDRSKMRVARTAARTLSLLGRRWVEQWTRYSRTSVEARLRMHRRIAEEPA